MSFARSDSIIVEVGASPDALFAHLDDQTRLASHMEKPSMMMLGGSMSYSFDDARGQAVGSLIRMTGRFLGLSLMVEEVVTVREPPRLKVWETRGVPQLIVLNRYRMGFAIEPRGTGSTLRVFIDYDPTLMGIAAAHFYARWCLRRIADDAVKQFGVA